MTKETYISASLDHSVFNLRLLKDFSVIAACGLTASEQNYSLALTKKSFSLENLLSQYLDIGAALLSKTLRESNAFITDYTLECEAAMQKICSRITDTKLTRAHMEQNARPAPVQIGRLPKVYDRVCELNKSAIYEAGETMSLFLAILNDTLDGKIFCYVLPSALMLFINIANDFINGLKSIENNTQPVRSVKSDAQLLKDCLDIAKALLDPSEEHFAAMSINLSEKLKPYAGGVLKDMFYTLSHSAVRYFIDLTRKLCEGNLKSILPPVLSDSFLRIANFIHADKSSKEQTVYTISEIVCAPAVDNLRKMP